MSRIMLVEDDPMIAEIYRKKFEVAGFEVACAVNGKEVLKLALEGHFDLILLDMVLPEMSGMDVLRQLKQSGLYDRNLKVFVFSNLSKAEHEAEAKRNGADGYIGKTDFSPSQLVDEIKRVLNSFSEQDKNRKKENGESKGMPIKRKKILFIEDEEIFLEMFGEKLKEEGYEVVYAKNGAWGIKEALENNYDLVITDMVMPAVGGEEIVRRLKAEENKKDVPIIVFSASLDGEDTKPVREMGITDFYEKTKLIPSDLARRVNELLA